MRFIARTPSDDENVNVSETSPLKEVSLLTGGLVALFVACLILTFLLVDFAVLVVSPEIENRLFGEIDWGTVSLLDSGKSHVDEDVEEVFQKLTTHWKDAPYAFKVRVSEVDLPNAFAFPGGTIVVTQGLLNMVQSENELAFVLGHELGHFRNRDHLRRMGRLMAAQIMVSAIFSSSSGGGAKESMVWLEKIILLGFSRDQESAADRFGASLVMKTYGHLGGAENFFRNLKEALPESGGLAQGFLSTHPLHEKRLDDLAQHAREEGWPSSGTMMSFGESENEAAAQNNSDAGVDSENIHGNGTANQDETEMGIKESAAN